ncbi:hypothetical protein BDP27DRAFT_1223952 [Rhodocollybia butyracea]|uniref:Uncharacterized protein n=1 Tax=Rhodocollybia butyracea TaxID=206335 RepID=A0A9P5U784_9AGAR|nr:hypothetical protein BDP27DRAFT_1223952 [Rhodocollybia butyracea]
MPLSQSPSLRFVASVFGTIWVAFGVNAILRPDHALTFFEFEPPVGAAEKKLVDSLRGSLCVYACIHGLAGAFTGAFTGDRKTLGWILLAGSAVAFADGVVCRQAGKGEWNHWGYAPMLTVFGSLLLGVADKS